MDKADSHDPWGYWELSSGALKRLEEINKTSSSTEELPHYIEEVFRGMRIKEKRRPSLELIEPMADFPDKIYPETFIENDAVNSDGEEEVNSQLIISTEALSGLKTKWLAVSTVDDKQTFLNDLSRKPDEMKCFLSDILTPSLESEDNILSTLSALCSVSNRLGRTLVDSFILPLLSAEDKFFAKNLEDFKELYVSLSNEQKTHLFMKFIDSIDEPHKWQIPVINIMYQSAHKLMDISLINSVIKVLKKSKVEENSRYVNILLSKCERNLRLKK